MACLCCVRRPSRPFSYAPVANHTRRGPGWPGRRPPIPLPARGAAWAAPRQNRAWQGGIRPPAPVPAVGGSHSSGRPLGFRAVLRSEQPSVTRPSQEPLGGARLTRRAPAREEEMAGEEKAREAGVGHKFSILSNYVYAAASPIVPFHHKPVRVCAVRRKDHARYLGAAQTGRIVKLSTFSFANALETSSEPSTSLATTPSPTGSRLPSRTNRLPCASQTNTSPPVSTNSHGRRTGPASSSSSA